MTAHRILASPMRWALVFALAAAAPAATPVSGQAGGGTVAASAQLLPPGVSGSGVQELRFGSVTYGQTVDVPPAVSSPGAQKSSAGWVFENLRKGHLAYLSTSLPAALTNGSSSIPIDWTNPNYGSICVFALNLLCQVTDAFDPGSQTWRLLVLPNSLLGTEFDLRVLLGARITVPSGIPPGVYTATATTTFAYIF